MGAELLFEVISTACERSSVIMTTNLTFEQLTEVLLSERLTGATLDRLMHRHSIVGICGDSYRLQDTRRRRRSGTLHAKTDSSVANGRTEAQR